MLNAVSSQANNTSKELSGDTPKIWAVASGKGGVGKSFIASNLGLALAQGGKRVVVIDLDLGGANLHTHLGVTQPKSSISHFINGSKPDLNEIVEEVPDTNIGLISGASDHLEIANLKHFQKQKIIRHLYKLSADYIILDLGAGTTYNTLDFFNLADRGILSVIPEPTSIENTHRFLKCAMYRKLRDIPQDTERLLKENIGKSMIKANNLHTLSDIIHAVHKSSPEHAELLRKKIRESAIHLIVNQVRGPADFQLGYSMALVWKKYYGKKPDSLSFLNHDESVINSLCEHKRYLYAHPQSRNSIHLKHLAKTIIDQDS